MGLAEALPSRVAATRVPCTHESPALQAQAGQLGLLPALPTLRLSQVQKQILHHSRKTGHQERSCSLTHDFMLMLMSTSTTCYSHFHAHVSYLLCSNACWPSSELRLWHGAAVH